LAGIPFPDEHAVHSQGEQQTRLQQALRRELAAIDAEIDKINRGISVWEDDRRDGTMTKERYRIRFAGAQQQLEGLRQQRAGLQDSHIAQPGRAALLEEVQEALAAMGNWTSTLEAMHADTLRGVYRSLIKAIKIDLAAGLLTVEYTEALARWCGRSSDTVPLPSQKAPRSVS
jgi:chromosome segregation ATPase